jgi:hypothetical protein
MVAQRMPVPWWRANGRTAVAIMKAHALLRLTDLQFIALSHVCPSGGWREAGCR